MSALPSGACAPYEIACGLRPLAAAELGSRGEQPARVTRRLFKSSSVSERMANAPSLAIHLVAGKPFDEEPDSRNEIAVVNP